MAVELEKIASILDEAYGQISNLESEKNSLESKVQELENELMLAKQAEDNATVWGSNGSDFGNVSTDTPSTYESAESRLDSFLSE